MVSIDRTDIESAAERIGPYVRRTPVLALEADLLDTARPVTAKLELLQHTGSFKPRGAFNAMLAGEIGSDGVIAASGGNHGLAVAYAAGKLGVPAEIFVPEVAPKIKVDKLHALGAIVHVIGGVYDNAQTACLARASESNAVQIHAYDQIPVLAGQATMAREISEQVADVDTVLIAAGGGGLGGGAAAWFGASGPRVVIVEPETSACFNAAKTAGQPVPVMVSGIAADSLGAGTVGGLAFDALVEAAAESVTVTDEAIAAAQRRLWDRLRLVVEPGGATAAAALLSGAYRPDRDERVVVVVCGANCDPQTVQGAPAA